MERTDTLPAPGGVGAQPLAAGVLAAVVGFASSFTVVLQGLRGVGADPGQAASGLTALCVLVGLTALVLALATRMPVSVAWSTPGAALLAATGAPEGGFPVAVGAFLLAAGLVVTAGLWRPFGRAIAAIPPVLASAMLAGVLMPLCLAPMRAVGEMPALALPTILAWALAWSLARRYAVPIAVIVAGLTVALTTSLPPGTMTGGVPHLVPTAPVFTLHGAVGIALPLFVVTMASQNVPGLAVLGANGYRPVIGPLFTATGLASAVCAPFGGHAVNLAAITAALCASPEAHPDPARRWIAVAVSGAVYLALGLGASAAAAFVAASPPLLIQSVAGLALLGSLGGALGAALARVEERVPAVVTFATTASGLTLFGIGAAFWGLVAGGVLWGLERATAPRRG